MTLSGPAGSVGLTAQRFEQNIGYVRFTGIIPRLASCQTWPGDPTVPRNLAPPCEESTQPGQRPPRRRVPRFRARRSRVRYSPVRGPVHGQPTVAALAGASKEHHVPVLSVRPGSRPSAAAAAGAAIPCRPRSSSCTSAPCSASSRSSGPRHHRQRAQRHPEGAPHYTTSQLHAAEVIQRRRPRRRRADRDRPVDLDGPGERGRAQLRPDHRHRVLRPSTPCSCCSSPRHPRHARQAWASRSLNIAGLAGRPRRGDHAVAEGVEPYMTAASGKNAAPDFNPAREPTQPASSAVQASSVPEARQPSTTHRCRAR